MIVFVGVKRAKPALRRGPERRVADPASECQGIRAAAYIGHLMEDTSVTGNGRRDPEAGIPQGTEHPEPDDRA